MLHYLGAMEQNLNYMSFYKVYAAITVKITTFGKDFRLQDQIQGTFTYQSFLDVLKVLHETFLSYFILHFTIWRLGLIHVEHQRNCVKYDVQWKDNLCFLKTPHAEGHCVVTQSATSGPLKGIERGEIHFILLPIVTQLIKTKSWNWFKVSLTFRQSYVHGMVRIYNLYTQQINVKYKKLWPDQ